jgi:hypothetical protein
MLPGVAEAPLFECLPIGGALPPTSTWRLWDGLGRRLGGWSGWLAGGRRSSQRGGGVDAMSTVEGDDRQQPVVQGLEQLIVLVPEHHRVRVRRRISRPEI